MFRDYKACHQINPPPTTMRRHDIQTSGMERSAGEDASWRFKPAMASKA
nr:hypothetical protein [Candidatus Sigynarchaeum springense]